MENFKDSQTNNERIQKSLRYVVLDGIFSWTLVSLTGGAFLIDYSLQLGASNVVIGLIAAIPFLGNAFQLPALFLIERIRKRRPLAFISSLCNRGFWILIAFIPWLFPPEKRLIALPVFLFVGASIAAISNASWNSWMKDLVSEQIRGRFFSRRLSISFAFGLVISLLAGRLIDLYKEGRSVEQGLTAYTVLFSFAALLGIIGSVFLFQAYEPPMRTPVSRRRLVELLYRPFQDANFRRLLSVTVIWAGALNLSAPFYTVYMFKRLHLSLGTVVAFSVFAQVMNVSFLLIWGKLADRFGNKPVFTVSSIIYIFALALWPFTALPEPHELTFVYLVVIHFLLGIAIAGVVISSMNIVYKLAPQEEATSYLVVNGACISIASAIAPLIGGFAAHYLDLIELESSLKWHLATRDVAFHLIDIRGFEFLFIFSIVFGLYALQRLAKVKEEGEAPAKVVYLEFFRETRRALRNLSTATGIYYIMNIPAFSTHRRHTKNEQKDSPNISADSNR
ncbi:MFS transporter [Candidatus Sumerlaeota bacterium]|nr:MFS transporter [Candidatus Sumerlaeota bacterium]